MLRFYFVFCFLFLTCFSVHLQSPHQPCVGMPSVGVHVCVCVCARDFATSLSTHLHLNLHPAPTSCELPVSIMRLLCPISGHKEMLVFFFFHVGNYHCVAVISFRGKIAYYWRRWALYQRRVICGGSWDISYTVCTSSVRNGLV